MPRAAGPPVRHQPRHKSAMAVPLAVTMRGLYGSPHAAGACGPLRLRERGAGDPRHGRGRGQEGRLQLAYGPQRGA